MMTAEAKEELSRVAVQSTTARRAEVAALLRFGGGVRIDRGHLVVEAQVELASTAHRLATNLGQLYTAYAHARPHSAGPQSGFLVQVTRDADMVSRRAGLLDRWGRPVRGLAAQVVAGSLTDLESAWRGAFLASGSLGMPGRPRPMYVQCPGPEAGSALVGAARRLGANAKVREFRGRNLVVVNDNESIGVLLTRMGAHTAWSNWEQNRLHRHTASAHGRDVNLEAHNARRSDVAAAITTIRVERALEILSGETLAPQFCEAARLRLAYPTASLEELGRRADPPMTKDTVAGRIRRLIARADRAARGAGIADTMSVATRRLRDVPPPGLGPPHAPS